MKSYSLYSYLIIMKTINQFMNTYKYSSNKKLNKAFQLVFESIMDKYHDYKSYWYDKKSDFINELIRYKKDFYKEIDYNYYQYWNLLIYTCDINKLFLQAWYKKLYWNEITRYKALVKQAINKIIQSYSMNTLDQLVLI